MLTDLRLAFRSLAKTPGFTAVALLIVALGIGAATTMFGTVNALVLRPVALPEPDRLVAIYETNLPRDQPFFAVSIVNFNDWRERTRSWTSLAALSWRAVNLMGLGDPEVVQAKQVTVDFYPTLGQPLQLGRNFLPEETVRGGPRAAIISDAFWRSRLGGTADVIGRTLRLDDLPHTIVGVAAPGRPFSFDLDITIPLRPNPEEDSRLNHEVSVYGRLKPGVTLAAADAELKAVSAQIWREHPDLDEGWSTRLLPFGNELVNERTRTGLYVLLGAVGLLLLIACANLSNLLLVRATARGHELAVRTALGASRLQIVRQILTEGLLVTLAGGLLGVLLSLWSVDLMRALPLPRANEISIDARVLWFACGVAVFTGLASGLGAALRASATRPHDALKSRTAPGAHRSAARDAMVIAQLAVSFTLLVGAILLGRGLLHLLRVDPGFAVENVVTVSLRPTGDEAAFYEQLRGRVAHLPGVRGVGLISNPPLADGNTSLNVSARGESVLPEGESVQADWRLVDGGYFDALQIPVLRGRTFEGLPPSEARNSVVVSAELARLIWGDADPVGRALRPGQGDNVLTVIGVVGDVQSRRPGEPPAPAFYWSMHRFIYGPMHLVVRSTGETAPLVAAIRGTVQELDPTVPVFRIRTMSQLRSANLEQEQILFGLTGGFTAIALLLAALGTYGVIAFSVQQRQQEFGIRLAIGAQTGDILRLVLGAGLRYLVLGGAFGLFGAFAVSRLLAATLTAAPSHDPLSYLVAAGLLAVVALGATLIPARRATRVDPMTALRAE